MADPSSPRTLPAQASLEQLRKQAKELARELQAGPDGRGGESCLAAAQLAIARQYGFATWAQLKQHVEALRPPGIEQYESIAEELAEAHVQGNAMAIRELNWTYGTSFGCDFHTRIEIERALPSWFASAAEARTPDLALADARRIVARSFGFLSWSEFAASLRQTPPPAAPPTATAIFISSAPPFYKIDWRENRLSVEGRQSAGDWDKIAAVIGEHRLTRLEAHGLSDEGMARLARLDCLTHLEIEGATLTDDGARHVARMAQLETLDWGGPKSPLTDRALEAVRPLQGLRNFKMCWTQGISDAGVAHLASADRLETVNLMGTPSGDGVIGALAGKSNLCRLHTGRGVTDTGLALLGQIPVFRTWHGGEIRYGLMGAQAEPNFLQVDGPFTDAGLASLTSLEGLFGLSFFWHCPAFTSAGLAPLRELPNLGWLGCEGAHCDDEAMTHIASMPRLRQLQGQGAVAGEAGFAALSRSPTIEYFWGRECPNLNGRGFAWLAAMPALRGLGVSCKHVDRESLAALPRFPALRELMPMDVSDEGFRHVGACVNLEGLWCMYCRETGDAATEQLQDLTRLNTYYAGMTRITDRSLAILARLDSLERVEFWRCAGITDAGVAGLAALPRLRAISLDGLQGVTRQVLPLFPASVRVSYSA